MKLKQLLKYQAILLHSHKYCMLLLLHAALTTIKQNLSNSGRRLFDWGCGTSSYRLDEPDNHPR